jgi:XTP/dITP diphosphohydrolase
MATFLCATRNLHKVGELRALLGGGHLFRTLDEFPCAPAVVEDAPTFEGNATKKAHEVARWLVASGSVSPTESHEGFFVLADDSGLEVDALGGAPGVHSARFAALDTGASGNSPDADNNAKLLRLLAGVPVGKRTARFRCVIAVAQLRNGEVEAARCFSGAYEGRIELMPRGAGGFGYDPLFVPDGFAESFAELGESQKNAVSHRARAATALRDWLGTAGAATRE